MGDPSATEVVRARLTGLRADGKLPPVLETTRFEPQRTDPADRFELPPAPSELDEVGLASEAWLLCDVDEAIGRMWPYVYRALTSGRPGPRILARCDPGTGTPPVGDLAAFGAIPRGRVAAPADARAVDPVMTALMEQPSPAYVRIPGASGPSVSDGSFRWGTAPVLRDGADLTLIGVGPVLAEVRALAVRLEGIGVSARVLDGASVKPIDAPAILRAARETGAILTAEEHHVLTGYGAMVASVTAMGYPVPVRRLGHPDLPEIGATAPGDAGRYAVTAARLDEEAWELLKARGKVQ